MPNITFTIQFIDSLTKEDEAVILKELTGDTLLVAQILGVRSALMLVRRCGGTYLRLNMHENLQRKIRDQKIRDDYDTGDFTGDALARKYGLSDRRIWDILGVEPEESPQLSMFDTSKQD